jgi:outer membrane protein assembly factor BamA
VYDNRHNVLNVRRGFFSELAYLNYNKRWGSAFNFHYVTFDSRLYRPLGKQVLALQLAGNFTTGDVPFNQLALIGGETIMRGYYLGRYRDRSYLATQAEYRWLPFPFSRRFGGVVFGAVGSVAPTPLASGCATCCPPAA